MNRKEHMIRPKVRRCHRIVCSGSRSWTSWEGVRRALSHERIGPGDVVYHGHCEDGADAIVDVLTRRVGAIVKRKPADWFPNGRLDRSAGPRRNRDMIDEAIEAGANLLLAFRAPGNSPGTDGAVRYAGSKGLRVKITTFNEGQRERRSLA